MITENIGFIILSPLIIATTVAGFLFLLDAIVNKKA